MPIQYIKGDATQPQGAGLKIIAHVCNDMGAWGKGFVVALSKRWKKPEADYRAWYLSKTDFALGDVQFALGFELRNKIAQVVIDHVNGSATAQPAGWLRDAW